jgi:hypothetical protein
MLMTKTDAKSASLPRSKPDGFVSFTVTEQRHTRKRSVRRNEDRAQLFAALHQHRSFDPFDNASHGTCLIIIATKCARSGTFPIGRKCKRRPRVE